VLNPGVWTHTSVAIRDALLGVSIPFIELHVANIHSREEWRHHSYFSDKAKAIIVSTYERGLIGESVMLTFNRWAVECRAMNIQLITS
jgi:3-dehydroquinate dehydratase